jgi:cellulose synthase/poly-beta-1,6-N-acetylglucosamine synthase-like glycosyltransferase
VRPRAFEPPPLRRYAGAEPLVSVIIAGRNPGRRIVTTIRSVLESNYHNVEIIFADDHSTDDSVALARAFERSGRVRVFANANHSGKPANLNVALMFARGQFVFVLDSDTQIFPDTIERMLPYFEDPRVGAVSASIFVRNRASLVAQFQSIEYLFTYTLTQLWRDRLGIIAIVCGMGAMFRTTALRGLGGFDMGLGDDTDLTIRLRKARWRLRVSLRARISTDVPETLVRLLRQRARWTRNMVKVRLRKHRDLGTFRYGFANGIVFYDNLFNRSLRPIALVCLAVLVHLYRGSEVPLVVGGLYGFSTIAVLTKMLISHDLTGEPSLGSFWLAPLYVFYRVPLLVTQAVQVVRELLRIKTWHPYVPRRIWDQIPHH